MFIAVVPPTLSLPRKGGGEFGAVFFSLADRDKESGLAAAVRFVDLGFTIAATVGTAAFLEANGVPVETVVAKAHTVDGIQPTEPADPAAVPGDWSSLLIALASVLARPSGTTCSQVSVVTATSLPLRSTASLKVARRLSSPNSLSSTSVARLPIRMTLFMASFSSVVDEDNIAGPV